MDANSADTSPKSTSAPKASASKTDTPTDMASASPAPDDSSAAAAAKAADTEPATGGQSATGGTKRKVVRRRKKKAKDGPKHPLTGYIRYMNDRRKELHVLKPDATTIEITKQIGSEWVSLPKAQKQPYLAAAKIDFDRYNQECIDYKKTLLERDAAAADSDAEIVEKPKKESAKSSSKASDKSANPANTSATRVPKSEKHKPAPSPERPQAPPPQNAPPQSAQPPTPTPPAVLTIKKELPAPPQPTRTGQYDIPIFTEEFLDHNKLVDFELRMLRKSNTDYEQQNSVLERHVENMAQGVAKLRADAEATERTNRALQEYLAALHGKLVAGLSGISIPGYAGGATTENCDEYVAALAAMGAGNAHGPGALNRAKDVLRKLDV